MPNKKSLPAREQYQTYLKCLTFFLVPYTSSMGTLAAMMQIPMNRKDNAEGGSLPEELIVTSMSDGGILVVELLKLSILIETELPEELIVVCESVVELLKQSILSKTENT